MLLLQVANDFVVLEFLPQRRLVEDHHHHGGADEVAGIHLVADCFDDPTSYAIEAVDESFEALFNTGLLRFRLVLLILGSCSLLYRHETVGGDGALGDLAGLPFSRRLWHLIVRVKENQHLRCAPFDDWSSVIAFTFGLLHLSYGLAAPQLIVRIFRQVYNLLEYVLLLDGKLSQLQPSEHHVVHRVLVGDLGVHLTELLLLFVGT